MASQPIGTLFDNIPRTESGPAPFSESLSTFQFLNRAAGQQWTQARELLESWYSDYPDPFKARLRNDFCSPNEGQHIGAWWELYTFTLYRRLEYSVTVEPVLPGTQKKIDFLVSRDNASMYVECAVDEGPVTGNRAIEAWIYDCINKVQNRNFRVLVVGLVEEERAEQPKEIEITRRLEEWLKELDLNRVTEGIESARARGELGVLPERTFPIRGWVLSCVAFPNPPDTRYAGGRPLGYRSSSPVWLNNVERIHDTVAKKGHKYGRIVASLNTPLVIAVLSIAGSAEEEDVTDAMFGRRTVQYQPGNPPSVEVVSPRNGGYWRGPPAPRGTRVSGVLFSQDMRPWSVASHLPSVWMNPWALNPLAEHPPLSSITVEDNGRIIREDATAGPHDVFELAP